MTIVQTEDTLGGKPRLEGRRISVLQIAEMYIDVRKSEISESTGMPDSCDAKNSPSFSAHTRTGGSRDAGKSPEIIADQLDIGLDEVHEALAYYYKHPDEMNELRERKRELRDRIKEKSNAPEKAER